MNRTIVGAVLVTVMGCGLGQGAVSDQGEEVLASGTGLTWEQFRAKVFVEPESGIFIVDHDTPYVNEKQLREFYELNVRAGQLIVNRIGSADDVWSATQKLNLTYCISDTFNANKATVVQTMASATNGWGSVANINFVYLPAEDANCTATNNNVVFDVRPINVNGQYLARAFFPSYARSTRNILIDGSSFGSTTVSLVGILRHELGHTLGFRHEHIRPESGATSTNCSENNLWRSLTSYDSASTMHYPQCNGTGSFTSLAITALDGQGAAALYGAPGSGIPDAGTPGVPDAGTPGTVTTETFSGSLARGATRALGPFAVTPGSNFRAVLSGTGDADLYVRFGAAPTASTYACRPYLSGSAEECNLTVPSTATTAYINVTGYAAATYSLSVTYTRSGTTPVPTPGTPRTYTASGSVTQSQLVQHTPIAVVPGSQLTVTMTGTGDPDLYVRFAGAPSLTLFDCRPYLGSASEACSLTVPASASQFYIAVHGYSAGTYSLTANYIAP